MGGSASPDGGGPPAGGAGETPAELMRSRISGEPTTLTVGGAVVTISNPAKVLFPKPKYTKLDLVTYYLAVAEGALRGAGGRPNMLVRFSNGIGAASFYQKRAPEPPPPWSDVVTSRFPSCRTAHAVVPR